MKTTFKALMSYGEYVDANRLEEGIYFCEKPFIYAKDETIESMIVKAEKVQDFMGRHQFSDEYFENLKQCNLVPIEITIRNS